jgi:rhodanese-related sulfurtransferase
LVVNINRSELLLLMKSAATVLDVLPEREYLSEHIPGALSSPLRSLDDVAVAGLSREKPVVVY